MAFLSVSVADLQVPHNAAVSFALSALVAVTLHLASQVHEPHGHLFVAGLAAACVGTELLLAKHWQLAHIEAALATLRMLGVFAATSCVSIGLYRVLAHPLRRIPGDLSCKLSMWTWVLADYQGRRVDIMQDMHARHGDLVRIGPRELSCVNPDAVLAIYGPTGAAAKARRGPWYGAQSMEPHVHSLQNEPTLPEHTRRRRDWDPAFSVKALGSYKSNIHRNAEVLLEQLERLSKGGRSVDLRECLMWFGFDTMGELGFGRSFGTLKDARTSHVVHLVERGVRTINTIGNVPYVAHVLRFLPSPIAAFEAWLTTALDWRMQKDRKKEDSLVPADLFAYLLGEDGKQRRKLNRKELQQDCMLMVVAGSDTTSNAMTFCLYELAQQPALLERVRREVEALLPDGGTDLSDGIFETLRDEAPLLNACIFEALRLWPPVPSGLQRTTTTNDMVLPGGVVVPRGIVVSTHTWTMHRDPRNFYRPEHFVPERWVRPAGVHNAKAWTPFGYGSTSCIGKQLAYMEMRLVLALFVLRFDMSVSPAAARAFRASVRDQFVIAAGPLQASLQRRHV